MIDCISAERVEREREAGHKNIKTSEESAPKECIRLYIATASSVDVTPVRTVSDLDIMSTITHMKFCTVIIIVDFVVI